MNRAFLGKEVDRMWKVNIIESATTECARPVVIMFEHDRSFGMFIYCRNLNAVTIRDTYPLTKMNDFVDALVSAVVLSILDVIWGCWEIPVLREDKKKTAPTSHAVMYRFNWRPFAIMNTPATFQQALGIMLNKYTWKFCLASLDDIDMFSEYDDQHLSNIEIVLSTLYAAGVLLKLKKWD